MRHNPFPSGAWLHHPALGLACSQGGSPIGLTDWLVLAAAYPEGAVLPVRASECVVALAPAQFRRPRLIVDNTRRA